MIFQDSNSIFWLIQITDGGQLWPVVVGAGPITPTILLDSGDSTLWQLGIDTLGRVTFSLVGSGSAVSSVRIYSTPSGIPWELSLVPFSRDELETTEVPSFTSVGAWVEGMFF